MSTTESKSIVLLPMYDWREQRGAHGQFWQNLGLKLDAAGIDRPQNLSRDDEAYWLNDRLLLGQTCGYPLSTTLKNKVIYIATPVYDVKGCDGPYYSSAIIARKNAGHHAGALAGYRFAFNGKSSLSGYRCVRAMFGEPETFFGQLLKSGSHRASANAVETGAADIAAIDAVCWHLLQIYEPQIASQLEVLAWTKLRPSLPFITSLRTSKQHRSKIQQTLLEFGPCTPLYIKGFELVDMAEYDALAVL